LSILKFEGILLSRRTVFRNVLTRLKDTYNHKNPENINKVKEEETNETQYFECMLVNNLWSADDEST